MAGNDSPEAAELARLLVAALERADNVGQVVQDDEIMAPMRRLFRKMSKEEQGYVESVSLDIDEIHGGNDGAQLLAALRRKDH
jgi:hypothetical protein